MPSVDTPYIIGVIREKEKGLLEEDEYTRIIQAPSAKEAIGALRDTPYGIYLEQQVSPFDALVRHLEEESSWLKSSIADERILGFMAARYDALHIANALIEYRQGKDTVHQLSSLGHIDREILTSIIWHEKSVEHAPDSWQSFLQEQAQAVREEMWSRSDLLIQTKVHLCAVMKDLAHTDLMHDITDMFESHIHTDSFLRRHTAEQGDDADSADIPDYIPRDAVDELQNGESAIAYDLAWDTQLIHLIRSYRHNPTGHDTVLSYWYAKEMEAKTVRLILSAKLGGLDNTLISSLKRPLYLSYE